MVKGKLGAKEREELGKRLRHFIYMERINQEKFGKLVGIKQPSVNMMLQGAICPLWVIYRLVNSSKYRHWTNYLIWGEENGQSK